MHRNKIVAGSVAALALALPTSALATESCTARGSAQVNCANQNNVTKQTGIAIGGAVSNSNVTRQVIRQRNNRGFQINLGLLGL